MTNANGSVAVADEAPKPLSQTRQRVVFHLTGFGVFNSVTDNPTTHLMRELPEELEVRHRAQTESAEGTHDKGFEVRTCDVLEVSAEGGGRQLRELFSKACGEVGEVRSIREGGEVDSGEEEFVGDCPAATVFVHFGVNIGAKEFALEIQGFNEATFGAPDERDYCPTLAPVDDGNPDTTHRRVTTVPVSTVLERLRGKGWGEEFVRESDDAGRFVCNYVYYTSLGLCEKLLASRQEPTPADGHEDTTGDHPASGQLHSLFVHVPPFSVIPKERQLALLVDCLSATAAALSGAAEGSSAESAEPSAPAAAATTPSAAKESLAEVSSGQKEASVLIEGSRDPSEFVHPVLPGAFISSATSSSPSTQLDKKSFHTASSIWGSTASPAGSSHSLASPDVNGGSLHDDGVRGEGWGANSGSATAAGGNSVGEADDDLEYMQGDDGDERRHETAADVTRKRLVEAGFDVLDVDAAMATTESDRFEVNMQFLLDMAPLLPPGAPTEKDGLFLKELSNGSRGSGGGEGCNDTSGRPPQVVKSRTKSAGSPAGMGGVSPKWVRDVSPVGRLVGNGMAAGGGVPSPTTVARRGIATAASGADYSGNNPAPARSGGLLSRIRRHRRGPSTASETAEDGGSKDLSSSPWTTAASPSRWKLPTAVNTGGLSPDNEYCRRTTGTNSNSPIRPYAGSGFTRRNELSAGWGETLHGSPNLRLVLLVRLDFAMGPGAIASHCCKAALAATRKAESSGSGNTLDVWREAGEAMVVLGVADVEALDAVLAIGGASHLPITMVRDTQAPWVGNVSAETCTVAAIGPAPMASIRVVVGALPVL